MFGVISPRSILSLPRASTPRVLPIPSPRTMPPAPVPLFFCGSLLLLLPQCSCTNLVRIPLFPVSCLCPLLLPVSPAFCLDRPRLAGAVRPGPSRYCGGRLGVRGYLYPAPWRLLRAIAGSAFVIFHVRSRASLETCGSPRASSGGVLPGGLGTVGAARSAPLPGFGPTSGSVDSESCPLNKASAFGLRASGTAWGLGL